MDPDPLSQTTLAILAGGVGSRMGRAKGSLDLQGRPILSYLLERLAWPGPKWLVTSPGRENPPGYEGFDRELVDPEAGVGPLRGILTALERVETPVLVVVPVDMPGLAIEQVREVVRQLALHASARGLMFRRRVGGDSQIEPFPIGLRYEAASEIRERLRLKQRSVHRLLEDPSFVSVPAPEDWSEEVWTNLNEPQNLETFIRKHANG
ncbi:MAG TPA: molybdenum cofactor guanylyltransferase [Tepidisphaeraceae bacterium]|nr:molybdenum cofactor guanylyltransferase [Tepidisphaeraceae bacterium]